MSDGRARLYLSSPKGDVYSHATGTTILADGEWHTIRGVRDVADGTIRIYVDGELEASAPDATTGDFASNVPITIGACLWGENTRHAQGSIDYVEIESTGRLVDGD